VRQTIAAGPLRSRCRSEDRGFSLVEMIVVTFLLALAMLGLLAVFDASARINKSETEVADAQSSVRYGVYQMTRVIRMAGSGGLFVTQAVLNQGDPGLAGITPAGVSYDNVPAGVTIARMTGDPVPVRRGTDMIEVRGVILSPLLGFDRQSGCAPCTGSSTLTAVATAGHPLIGQHVNHDAANRPQFAAIDAYTAGTTSANPRYVLVSANDDIHGGCSDAVGNPVYTQSPYNVGVIGSGTTLVTSNSFGAVDFANAPATQFNYEIPAGPGPAAQAIGNVRRAGIMDDIIFFIDNTDPRHPALAQGIRRGAEFDIILIADDVEDMQIAYGVDTNGDEAITRLPPVGAPGPGEDPYVSAVEAGDEWVPNAPRVTGDDNPLPAATGPYIATDFQTQQPPPATFTHTGLTAPRHCPRLHAVMISLLAKSRDPDPTYRAVAGAGYRLMNVEVAGTPPIPITTVAPGSYRRRLQTLKINLRNYSFQGVVGP